MSDLPEALTKVLVDLPNHWASGGESMWAQELGDDRYRIYNIPFYAYGLNYLDVVRAYEPGPDLKPVVESLESASGHRTLRVIFSDASGEGQRVAVVEQLRRLGAEVERASETFWAIDIPPEKDYDVIFDALAHLEKQGALGFETCEAQVEGSFDADPEAEEFESYEDPCTYAKARSRMAWWITVYCRKSVANISAQQVELALREPDYETRLDEYTWDEGDDVDITAALARLKVVAVSTEAVDFEIHFLPEPDGRPITVHVWRDSDRLRAELEEARDSREAPPAALPILDACTEIVAIELGFSHLRTCGVIFANELARWLTERGEGVAADDDNDWFIVKDGEWAEP